ncbi:hypothetical protein C3942_21795 [Solimonas fluminis]|uniref:Uncharacterized protein n=1 Tax=Solimonas fluminis TaxID=2086571 RepID=A0A2S5T9W7_9GAMM|nr:hypothetical protein C3942_21795 [Solimonas fluminis]
MIFRECPCGILTSVRGDWQFMRLVCAACGRPLAPKMPRRFGWHQEAFLEPGPFGNHVTTSACRHGGARSVWWYTDSGLRYSFLIIDGQVVER